VDGVGLTSQQWQTELLLVNLPSLNHIATCLLAELHKRKGYFPSILRLRPIVGNSQAVCDGSCAHNVNHIDSWEAAWSSGRCWATQQVSSKS